MALSDNQRLRYSRHLLLDDISEAHQEAITQGTALIVGLGGLGSPAAMYLASAGVGHLILADADQVDLTNLQRQILHREATIGVPKVVSAARHLADLNSTIRITALAQRLDGQTLRERVAQADVVLDCTDNFATRHAINQACVDLRTPLVSGSAVRFDGQLLVMDPRVEASACYHCLFPLDQHTEELRCATLGVFAPLTGIIGTTQAAEALKLLGGFGRPAINRLMMLDARTMQWTSIGLTRDEHCAACGEPGQGAAPLNHS
jgi:molybdopterin-synthase adenylyltransferase